MQRTHTDLRKEKGKFEKQVNRKYNQVRPKRKYSEDIKKKN